MLKNLPTAKAIMEAAPPPTITSNSDGNNLVPIIFHFNKPRAIKATKVLKIDSSNKKPTEVEPAKIIKGKSGIAPNNKKDKKVARPV